MFCAHCGAALAAPGQKVCSACGALLPVQQPLPMRAQVAPPPRQVPSLPLRELDPTALFLLLFGGIFGLVDLVLGSVFIGIGAAGVLPVFLPIGIGILVLGSVGATVALRGLARLRATRRVWQTGDVVVGHVLEAGWDRSMRVNRRSPVRVRYSYAVLGSQYEGTGRAWDDRLSQLPVGTEITLLVDPQEPQRSIWVSQTP